jgi:hypothetical protein
MNSTTLATYYSLFRFAMKRQDGLGKLVNGALFAVALGGLLLAALVPDLKSIGYLLNLIAVAGVLISYWFFICVGMLLQNTPANACTVPFLHRRLKRLSALIALSMSLIYAGHYALLFGHFIPVFCFSLMSFAMFMSTNMSLYLLYFLGFGTAGYWLPFLQRNEQSSLTMLSLIVASFSYGIVGLHLTFRQGGDAHFKVFKTLGHLLRQATPSDQANKGWEQVEWLYKIISYPYFRELRSVTKWRPSQLLDKTALASGNRRLFALGFSPGLHWSVDIFNIAVNLFLASLAVVLEENDKLAFILKAIILASPIMCGFGLAMSCKMSLYQTRKEQALLLLSPLTPMSTALNPYVMHILWRRYVQSWLISATAVGFIVLLGMSQGVEHMAVWAMGLVLNPLFFVYVLRDYSQLNQNAVNEMGVIVLAIFIVATCILLNWASGQNFIFVVIGLTIFATGAAFVGVRRWRSLSSGAALLPVGHRHS